MNLIGEFRLQEKRTHTGRALRHLHEKRGNCRGEGIWSAGVKVTNNPIDPNSSNFFKFINLKCENFREIAGIRIGGCYA